MSRIDAILTAFTITFVLSMVIPDNFADQFRFGGVPLSAYIIGGLCLVLIPQFLREPEALTPGLAGGVVALTLMSFWGYFRDNVGTYLLKFFVADIVCFTALIAGYSMARILGPEKTTKVVLRTAMVCGVVIIATYAGLSAGIVSTAFNIDGRTVTASIFNAVGILLVFLPWTAISPSTADSKGEWLIVGLFAIAAGTSILSATRSAVIAVGLAAAFLLILKRKRLRTTSVVRLAWSGVLLFLVLFFSFRQFGTFVIERLDRTQLNEESRSEELSLLWPQIQGDLLAGQGMGSRFISNVIVDQSPLASAPHIGIATFLMKGGVFLFFGYALLPLLVSVVVLFGSGFSDVQRGAATSVLMFIGVSCISGGWSPLLMFGYGMAISSMAAGRWAHRSLSGRPVIILRQAALDLRFLPQKKSKLL